MKFLESEAEGYEAPRRLGRGKTWRVTEGHREREGRGVKFLENEAEGYEDFLVEKA